MKNLELVLQFISKEINFRNWTFTACAIQQIPLLTLLFVRTLFPICLRPVKESQQSRYV